MAHFSKHSIVAKTFLLMAYGKPYRESPGMLVIDSVPGGGLTGKDKYDACGFDLGSITAGYETHAQARTHLKEFQSGQRVINEHREIDAEKIRIHEMTFDIFAVDMDDEEHESLAVLGSLDHMKYRDREVVLQAFPVLKDIDLHAPEEPAFRTRDGLHPQQRFSGYVLAKHTARAQFNALAQTDPVPNPLPMPANGETSAGIIRKMFYSGSYYSSLKGAAEEIGKARMGIIDSTYTDLLYLRLYDTNETYRPAPPLPPRDIRREALEIIAAQDTPVARCLLESLVLRRQIARSRTPTA